MNIIAVHAFDGSQEHTKETMLHLPTNELAAGQALAELAADKLVILSLK